MEAAVKAPPIAGEILTVEGCTAFVIHPVRRLSGGRVPSVWYAPTLPDYPNEAERCIFDSLLSAGLAIAGIDVSDSFGSPAESLLPCSGLFQNPAWPEIAWLVPPLSHATEVVCVRIAGRE